MARVLTMWLALVSAGCFGGPGTTANSPGPTEDASLWQGEVGSVPEDKPKKQERLGLVTYEGSAFVTLDLGGTSARFEMPLEHAAGRISDLSTLAFPQGHIRFAAGDWFSTQSSWAEALSSAFRGDDDAAPQTLFELETLGAVDPPLETPGQRAQLPFEGAVQIGGRRTHVAGRVEVIRRANGGLSVRTLEPVTLALVPAGVASTLRKAAETAGWSRVGPEAHVELQMDLAPEEVERLPTFVRMPVLVKTVDEIHEEMARREETYEQFDARMKRQGVPERARRKSMSPEHFDKMRQFMADLESGAPGAPPGVPHRGPRPGGATDRVAR